MSIGGFRCLPDYTFSTIPENYAALVLVGGLGWWGKDAKRVVPVVEDAIKKDIAIGAICDASAFLGANGFLNKVSHTSNGLNYLKNKAGSVYSGEELYCHQPSVYTDKLVTASGAGYVDFACNMLVALKATNSKNIRKMKDIFGSGLFPANL